MWIRMRQTVAGPQYNPALEAGKDFEVSDREGELFISVGAAERIEPPAALASPISETAAMDEGEKAVSGEPLAANARGEAQGEPPLIEQLTGKKAAKKAKKAG